MITRRQFSQAALAGLVAARPHRTVGRRRRRSAAFGSACRPTASVSSTQPGTAEALDILLDAHEDLRPRRVRALVAADRAGAAGRAATPRPAAQAEGPRRAAGVAADERPRATSRASARRFADAGMTVYAYNLSFNDSFTDDEIHRGSRPPGRSAPKRSPPRRRCAWRSGWCRSPRSIGMPVAMHNHSNVDRSERVRHAGELHRRAGDVAALPHQPRHRPLHRRRLRRARVPRGSITTASPTCTSRTARSTRATTSPGAPATRRSAQMLAWLKQHMSPVRAYVEYEYPGTRGAVAEVTACAEFAQAGADGVTPPARHGPGRPGVRRRPPHRRRAAARLRGRRRGGRQHRGVGRGQGARAGREPRPTAASRRWRRTARWTSCT